KYTLVVRIRNCGRVFPIFIGYNYAGNIPLKPFIFHIPNIHSRLVVNGGRLRNADIVEHVVYLSVVDVETTGEPIIKEAEIDSYVQFLFYFPSNGCILIMANAECLYPLASRAVPCIR